MNNRCTGTNRDGTRCLMAAVQNGKCFAHSQLPHAEIFQWSAGDIEYRIRCLTPKQIQALERVCNGETYQAAAAVLGVTFGSFANRLSIAKARAGVKTIQQLIAMYAAWRVQKVGDPIP